MTSQKDLPDEPFDPDEDQPAESHEADDSAEETNSGR